MQVTEQKLWSEYKEKGNMQARETLLEKNIPLVRFTIDRMNIPQNCPWFDFNDLMTAGIIGLIDALEKFDLKLGGKFSTYAYFRIRGAILDEMRALDWVPRSVRRKTKELEQAYEVLQKKLLRPVTEKDAARYLGRSLQGFHELLQEAKVLPVVSLDQLMEDREKKHRDVIPLDSPDKTGESRGGALSQVAAKETRELLGHLIENLPKKERLVLTLYYYEELTFREIAAVLEVTESRICQIHGQAIIHLRATIKTGSHDFVMA